MSYGVDWLSGKINFCRWTNRVPVTQIKLFNAFNGCLGMIWACDRRNFRWIDHCCGTRIKRVECYCGTASIKDLMKNDAASDSIGTESISTLEDDFSYYWSDNDENEEGDLEEVFMNQVLHVEGVEAELEAEMLQELEHEVQQEWNSESDDIESDDSRHG